MKIPVCPLTGIFCAYYRGRIGCPSKKKNKKQEFISAGYNTSNHLKYIDPLCFYS
jgi:hypothetical protein